MKQYECSVVVVQYNSSWEKVKRTLNSIINQRECHYEIIVADDGSKSTGFDKIREFFKQNDFLNYQLIDNKENMGTVKNVISGIKVATGKYVRVIAPGDMLYSNVTLRKIVDFMNENQAKEMFGKMAFFNEEDGKIEFISQQAPCNFRPYRSKDLKSIKKHLLVLGDNISGASYTWERNYYLECLMRIEGKVTYLEDCVNAYTIYDGHEIYFMDEFVTWYEYGTGISTSKSNKWTRIIEKDWILFLERMLERYPGDSYIRKARLYYKISYKGTLLSKIIKNLLFFNRFIYSRFRAKFLNEIKNEVVEKENVLQYF